VLAQEVEGRAHTDKYLYRLMGAEVTSQPSQAAFACVLNPSSPEGYNQPNYIIR